MITTRHILSSILLAAFIPLAAFAQNTASQEAKRANLEKEIAQLERQIKDNSAKSHNALNTLTLVRKQISSRKALLDESDRDIRVLGDSIYRAQRRANALQARLDTMTFYYTRLVKSAYKNRDARVWYYYIFSSSSIGQATRRYAYLRDLSKQMNLQAAKIKEAKSQLQTQLARLGKLKARAESLKAARQADLDKLNVEETKSGKLVSQLNSDKSRYQKQLSTKRKQVEALNREIQKIIAQAMADSAKKPSGGSSQARDSKPIDYKLADEFASNRGKLPWPADGPVVEGFGRHTHPVYKSIVMPANNGINIGLSAGAAVKAVFNGEVKRIIVMPGYNKCILIQHGNYFTFYCKMDRVNVKAGEKVQTGEVIGTVDTIDNQTELHFQVWKEKTPQNPELWLRPR